MKRLLFGFGVVSALVYAWRRVLGAEPEPQPTWQGTDNDPEDAASLERDLLEETRAPTVAEPEKEPESEPQPRPPRL